MQYNRLLKRNADLPFPRTLLPEGAGGVSTYCFLSGPISNTRLVRIKEKAMATEDPAERKKKLAAEMLKLKKEMEEGAKQLTEETKMTNEAKEITDD
jgi:predicted metal-binding transcription factor (methanogenesis marker protein 9)